MSAADMSEIKAILMRKLVYILLIAYILVIVKPMLPLAIDTIAHTFWKNQHMLVVHEVNGKFHVHTELVNGARQSEKEKHTVSNKAEVQECVQVRYSYLKHPAAAMPVATAHRHCYLCYYARAHVHINYPPPRAGA